ncbi:MAG TPA: efflux transporter periplasmic adaptor subunit [Cyanobacteria bacterium UBA8803]|nr:efflux transporter periplasmic adaptor subunit [Cyanobacteria bacterium UBA9273]HBL61119.1 efflux transporter periplasmic adaptor subunit [Cyanobacteria bacterium UBA8803]
MTTQFQSPSPSPWYKSMPKQLSFRWPIGLLLVAGIVGGGYGISRSIAPSQRANPQMVTMTAQQKSLPITISANGTIKPERTINLSPKTSGYLKRLLVKEGDRVREGQIVAYMDDSNLQGQLTQARAQVAQQEANLNKLLNGNRSEEIAQAQAQLNEAQSRLQQLEAGNRSEDITQAQAQLNKAQADLQLAEDDLRRHQSLLSAGAISEQTLVQKRSARDAAQAAVDQAQAALKLQQSGTRSEEIAQARSQVEQRQQALNLIKAGARPEEIDAARAQVESARGALQIIQTQFNDTMIKAPFTGVVTRKYADPGSFVTPTTAGSSVEGSASNSILTLASTYQVVAYLDEANVARVKFGQPVKITADAYPDRTFKGTVSQIAAQATTTANVTSFEVKVSLDATAQQLLKVGMNVETEFQVGQLDNAILIPSAAIVRQQKGTGVYVVDRDRNPVFKPIEIGITIDEQTEVKSGLSKDDQVLLSFPPGMEPKAQLRGPLGNLMRPRNRSNNNSSSGNNPAPPPAP